MKRIVAVLFVLVILMSLCGACFAASDAATLSHGVVMIVVGRTYSDGVFYEPQWEPLSRGSGFFVGRENENPQYLVTNRHVIEDYLLDNQGDVFDTGEQYVRTHIRVYYSSNDYEEAYVVDYGPAGDQDFAILRLDKPTDKRAALPIEIPTDDMRGQDVWALGFPAVAENELFKSTSKAGESDVVLSKGAVNSVYTETGTGTQQIMHKAMIHPGNSGGPLVSVESGKVIGINTWNYDGGNETIYYAIGMKSLEPFLKKNNIPSSLDEKNQQTQTTAEPTEEPTPTPTKEPGKPEAPSGQNKNWYIYAILGAAIVGVIVLLFVLLKWPPTPPKTTTQKTPPETQTQRTSRVLIGVAGPLKDKRFELKPGGKLLIGRSSSCNVRFKDGTPGVSGTHCEIRFDGKKATITDLKSSYGTFVDQKKLSPNVPVTLHRSLAIDIGSEKNRFVLQ